VLGSALWVLVSGCGGGGGSADGVGDPSDADAGDDSGALDVSMDGSQDDARADAGDAADDTSTPPLGDADAGADAAEVVDDAATGDALDDAATALDADDSAGSEVLDDALAGDAGDVGEAGAIGDSGATAWDPRCMLCHGSVNPAPPVGLGGETKTSDHAVGAHQSHLAASSWHHLVDCSECHVVPTVPKKDPAVPTHMNSVVDLAWGPIAKAGTYTAATVTCTGSYCHGATLKADATGLASNRTPIWTTVDGSQRACGKSCHTLPPGGGHPSDNSCPKCHGAVISSFTAGDPPTVTWKDASLHVDGKLQLDPTALDCTSCHGNVATKDPSPPRGTKGETATTQAAVGAHQAHLATSTWSRDVVCADCHTLPTSTTHTNGVTDFTWGAVSTAGGAKPTYANATSTCSDVYCHGTTLLGPVAGGSVKRAPVWNVVDGSYVACGSTCHTNPPGGAHPGNTNCATCHGKVIASYDAATKTATWVDRKLHVDGKVDVDSTSLTCTSCHGNAATNQPAPPKGTKGETATSQQAVGAHQAHLAVSSWSRDVVCSDCHTLPTSTSHSNGVTDFAWGAVSTASGATPAYDKATATCNSVYCHGVTLLGPIAGGTVKRAPAWNVVDGSAVACGSTCHTNPPGGTHPNATNCATCHGAVISSYDAATKTATWADRTRHVDGKVDVVSLTCTSCHGDPTTNQPAPPKGTKGETATSQQAVGAHAQHLGTRTQSRDVLCSDCHTLPTSTSHANGATDFAWSAVSTASGASPSYNGATATCTNVYCHGATLLGPNAGGTIQRTPVWNLVNGSYDACGSTCHTNPPGGTHPASTSCPTCHGAVIASYDAATKTATWSDRTRHVNGTVEVSALTCTSCHGTTATNQPAPPLGTKGETATTQKAVGAHAQHLGVRLQSRDVLCTDCHAVPASMTHSNGVTDFAWGPVSTASGATPSYATTTATCSNVYCHGTTLLGPNTGGTVSRAPVWNVVNGSYDTCGNTCHTNPPGGTHPPMTNCPTCHGAVIATYNATTKAATWADRTRHVNGTVEVVAMTCTTCHGTSPSQVNPPVGVSGETTTSTLGVGRHVAHLAASASHVAFACNTCHTVPAAGDTAHALQYVATTDLSAAGHHGDVLFANGGTGMTFNVSATAGAPVNARGTCTGACHSNGRGGAPVVLPYWAGGTWPTANVCGNCHAATMSGGLGGRHGKHDGEAVCADCHPAANTSTHMNGAMNVNSTITGSSSGGGGSISVKPPGASGNPCAAGLFSCTGTCHGKNHPLNTTYCW
jgi:predicted CxxxxCH...CXXCH cytochrome family protein